MSKTFKAYLESQGKSRSTIQHYQTYLGDFLSFLDQDNTEVENTTGKEVMAFLNHLQHKGQENNTRSIRLNVIRHFFDFQIEHGHRQDNPAQGIKIRGAHGRRLYPILSRQELEQIHNDYEIPSEEDPRSSRNWFHHYQLSRQRNKAVLSLLVHQGLTTREITDLNLQDLHLKQGEIYIAPHRKGAERTLQLKAHQIIELMEYQHTVRAELLKFNHPEDKRLFLGVPTLGNQQATQNSKLNLWKGLTKDIKEKHPKHPKFINFKQVRASVITHWLSSHNLREVQYMAGHKYVSTTERYLVGKLEDLQTDIDQFHPLG